TDIAMKVYSGEPVNLETGYVNVIWQGDAVAHTLQALAEGASPPTLLNITGAETVSVRFLAEQFGERFGRRPVFEGTEADTALLSNAGRSHALFGKPAVSVEQMIDWTAEWILQKGDTLNKPTHFESR